MRYCFYCLFFVSMLVGFSCSNNHQNPTAKTSTQKQKPDTADAHLTNDLSIFCTSQVNTARMAISKVSTQKVKELAKQNAVLYAEMGKHLNDIAAEYNIKLSSALSPEAEKTLLI